MKPLLVLVSVFVIALLTLRQHNDQVALSARIAMSTMLVFTAISHFIFTPGMAMMIPKFIPFKTALVYLTGILEGMAAVGLFIPGIRSEAAGGLILLLVLLLPANIYAAYQHIDFQTATTNGNGPVYLWFRVPLQILFIVWVYLSSIGR